MARQTIFVANAIASWQSKLFSSQTRLLRGKADYWQAFQHGLLPAGQSFATAQLVDL
jgi:hypothetical protein